MNGQPTAQNNRETGCDGEFPGFRNNNNPAHMQELADYWNVDVSKIPSWSDPIHIMSMLQMMEAGTIKMMWVNGTNPAVSLPKLGRIRDILTDPGLFVRTALVVSETYQTYSCLAGHCSRHLRDRDDSTGRCGFACCHVGRKDWCLH